MRRILRLISVPALLILLPLSTNAAEPACANPTASALKVCYSYPVSMLPLTNDGEPVRMAYMDVAPMQPNGRIVVLAWPQFSVELLAPYQDAC